MGTSEASIIWMVGDENLVRTVHLRDNKLLLSLFFLQNLLPPSHRFATLKAVIQVGEECMDVETPSQWDVEGHLHFLLDSSLSRKYVMEHCIASAYISDSEYNKSFFNTEADSQPFEGSSDDISLDKPISIEKKHVVIDLESLDDEKPTKEFKSTMSWLLETSRSARLNEMIKISGDPVQVNEIPRSYNGNIIFELPPTYNEIKRMEGMEQKFDGHLWTRPHTTNMSIDCTVRLSNCLGSMELHVLLTFLTI